ncbi:MAG: hypothetical protein M3021_07040 [Actinomycetota bacterium]|nr:hypothetical protein [Actinomycetota bacterium]
MRCVTEVLAGTDTPLGLIPLGTGNLLARNLGLDVADPFASARVAPTHGHDGRIDVVKAVVDQAQDEQAFLVMAGLGFDADVMAPGGCTGDCPSQPRRRQPIPASYGRTTTVPLERSSIRANTSGAVRFSPSRFGFPKPW